MGTKIKIYEDLILNEEPKIYMDPANKLVDKISDIIEVSNRSSNFTKSFNFNKRCIHSILYKYEEMIKIDANIQINNLPSFIFYLASLIEDNKFIINYMYNLDFIKRILHLKKNNYLYNIINSKITQILLFNYKGLEIEDEERFEKEIKKIELENKNVLDNNIPLLKENNISLSESDIMEGDIEMIYIKIIISLIKSEKLSDINYMNEIISSLNLEYIDLTKNMFDTLKEELNSNEDFFKQYNILKLNDLLNVNIINFHYFLLKYILKSSIYIYQIPFLSRTRKNIINLIKSNNVPNLENLEKQIKYVIQQYLDFPYYYDFDTKKKENERAEYEKNNKQTQSNAYDKNTTNNDKKSTKYMNDNSSKFSENEKMPQNINNNHSNEEIIIQRQILNYSIFILHTNEKGKDPYIIFDKITIGKKNINITNIFLKMKKQRISDANFSKFWEFLEKFKEKLKNEFKNNYCLRIKLLFQNENEKSNLLFDKKEYNISCKYYFYSPIDNSEITFKTENILNNNPTESEGFIYFMEEINNDNYKDEIYEYNEKDYINSDFNSKKENSKLLTSKQKDDNISYYVLNNTLKNNDVINDINNKSSTLMCTKIEIDNTASKEEIISFIKVINQHRKSTKYCGQLSNGFFVSYGGENSIYIYDKNYELKVEIKNLDEAVYDVHEKKSKKSNSIELMASCNRNLNLITLNKSNFQYNVKQYQIPDIICLYCCEINGNNYIVSGESIVVGFKDLFDTKKFSKPHKFIKKTYRSGININNKRAALTSNSLVKNGEDCLLIIDIESQKIEKKISGYSHVYDPNGLASIHIGNKTILLSACKKYFQNQRNGILVVNSPLAKEEQIEETFYPTEDFEVNCICPLYVIQNNEKKPTNFFLAGGFDSEKGEGVIQLYQVLNDNEKGPSSIEYLQDIEYEVNSEFHGFEMTVTCIKQSDNGNIIISCIDGNIYLFSKPNLEFYLQDNYI